ncbi:uncharacterized protein PFL1_03922 [Pseudozyma flocculosa PF-1]|uniref:Zn(2)-C6 fungal-type domain-containing protein n=2 Tax=Pseudozyma flocculosa TaxID=84751 RepID=A0A5C3EZZ1_9BASI|nr:uncharacterized protein PFL1_03922 [Pseudozyma flocculosa PF-1]EPQ28619.1 hypothetical protein PFL1_03922 [Pseudozyma flocculosa PF-1]SPO36561.1 uncharacterized protein PSFLO_02032 [Pseudozyma flocculosa]
MDFDFQHAHHTVAGEGSSSSSFANIAQHPAWPDGSPSSSPPFKRGSNLACLNCRKIKTKCGKAQPSDERCKRCVRLNLNCQYRPHHRGKKLKDSPDPAWSSRSLSASTSSEAGILGDGGAAWLHGASMGHSGGGPYDAMPFASTSCNTFSGYAQQPLFARGMAHARDEVTPPRPSGFASEWIDPARGERYPSSQARPRPEPVSVHIASSLQDDAVRLGMISPIDAMELFDSFPQQQMPDLPTLGPPLTSYDYVRERWPLSFSAILTTASTLRRPDLYERCHGASDALMNLAAVQDLCSLDHVLAILVTCMRSGVPGALALRRLTRAIGYAYELGLHASFDGPGASYTGLADGATAAMHQNSGAIDERDWTHNAQRIWIQLCVLEGSLCGFSRPARPSRPRLIRSDDIPDAQAWLLRMDTSAILPRDAALAQQLHVCRERARTERQGRSNVGPRPVSMPPQQAQPLPRDQQQQQQHGGQPHMPLQSHAAQDMAQWSGAGPSNSSSNGAGQASHADRPSLVLHQPQAHKASWQSIPGSSQGSRSNSSNLDRAHSIDLSGSTTISPFGTDHRAAEGHHNNGQADAAEHPDAGWSPSRTTSTGSAVLAASAGMTPSRTTFSGLEAAGMARPPLDDTATLRPTNAAEQRPTPHRVHSFPGNAQDPTALPAYPSHQHEHHHGQAQPAPSFGAMSAPMPDLGVSEMQGGAVPSVLGGVAPVPAGTSQHAAPEGHQDPSGSSIVYHGGTELYPAFTDPLPQRDAQPHAWF